MIGQLSIGTSGRTGLTTLTRVPNCTARHEKGKRLRPATSLVCLSASINVNNTLIHRNGMIRNSRKFNNRVNRISISVHNPVYHYKHENYLRICTNHHSVISTTKVTDKSSTTARRTYSSVVSH